MIGVLIILYPAVNENDYHEDTIGIEVWLHIDKCSTSSRTLLLQLKYRHQDVLDSIEFHTPFTSFHLTQRLFSVLTRLRLHSFFLYFRPKIYSHGFTPFFFAWKGLLVVNLSIEVESMKRDVNVGQWWWWLPFLFPTFFSDYTLTLFLIMQVLTWKEMRWKFTEKTRWKEKGTENPLKRKSVFFIPSTTIVVVITVVVMERNKKKWRTWDMTLNGDLTRESREESRLNTRSEFSFIKIFSVGRNEGGSLQRRDQKGMKSAKYKDLKHSLPGLFL